MIIRRSPALRRVSMGLETTESADDWTCIDFVRLRMFRKHISMDGKVNALRL